MVEGVQLSKNWGAKQVFCGPLAGGVCKVKTGGGFSSWIIIFQNFLILDLFCNFEYFKSTLLMTQIKLQFHQQTLKYPTIFYATKISFYAIFTLCTQ